jgi:hypothetical protein
VVVGAPSRDLSADEAERVADAPVVGLDPAQQLLGLVEAGELFESAGSFDECVETADVGQQRERIVRPPFRTSDGSETRARLGSAAERQRALRVRAGIGDVAELLVQTRALE